jgi:hypothetical protein
MAKPVMSGIWKGEVRGFRYCLDVVQLGSHVSGLLHVGGFEKTGNISGWCEYPDVVLSGYLIKHGAHFQGRFTDPNTITGTLKYQKDSAEFTFHRSSDTEC